MAIASRPLIHPAHVSSLSKCVLGESIFREDGCDYSRIRGQRFLCTESESLPRSSQVPLAQSAFCFDRQTSPWTSWFAQFLALKILLRFCSSVSRSSLVRAHRWKFLTYSLHKDMHSPAQPSGYPWSWSNASPSIESIAQYYDIPVISQVVSPSIRLHFLNLTSALPFFLQPP